MAIAKVWIEEGCIVCNACEAECPDVFLVTADSCHIKADARVDGKQDENAAAKAALRPGLGESLEAAIVAAAAACPVSVIQYEQVATAGAGKGMDDEIDAALGKALGAPAAAAEPAPEAAPAPASSEPAPAAALVAPPPPAPVPPPPAPPPAGAENPKVEAPKVEAPNAEAPKAEAPKAETPRPEAPKAEVPAAVKPAPAPAAPKPEPEPEPKPEPEPTGPYVYDYKTAPNRQVVMPKTVPLPSFHTWEAEQKAAAAAEEAKWQKQLADFETAKAKAAAEGKPEPKAPVKAAPRKDDNDLKVPVPSEAQDPDLLRLQALLGDKVSQAFEQAGELTCQVHPDCIVETLLLCKGDPELRYEMLADQTATHYPAAEGFDFSIVYHLTSIRRRKRLRLRVLVKEGQAVDSATQVYPSANWMEREIWDMFGIPFLNHPDLTRILCPEDWEGFPLRKEYPVTGWGQRDIDFREDRSGVLMRMAMEKAGQLGINLRVPTAD